MTCPHGGVALMAMVGPEVLLSRLPKNEDYIRCWCRWRKR
jgi:hypothetical protein